MVTSASFDPRFTGGDVRFSPASRILMGTPQGARDAFGDNVDTTMANNPLWARMLDGLSGAKLAGGAGLPTSPLHTQYGNGLGPVGSDSSESFDAAPLTDPTLQRPSLDALGSLPKRKKGAM